MKEGEGRLENVGEQSRSRFSKRLGYRSVPDQGGSRGNEIIFISM